MAGSGDPLAQLRQGDPGPLYFIYGKERFLVDRAVDLVREKALDPRTRDFNYELLYGKEAGASRILQAARTLPMMAKRRLILVRDADEMKADELAGLIPYLSNPAPETCLVFVGEKIDQRIKFFTEFKKKGVLIKLDPLYERQLPGFVRDEARLKSVSFEAGAAELLSDEIGADLGQLADAVERLAIYVGDRKRIGVEDVEAAVSGGRQRNIFELGNAVGQGRRGDALAILGSMQQVREPAVRIIAMLTRHVRQLWKAQELLKRGTPRNELAPALGVPPFFVDGIIEQARRLDRAKIERYHDALYRADCAIKSSRLDDDRIVEQLIVELTRAEVRPQDERARANRG